MSVIPFCHWGAVYVYWLFQVQKKKTHLSSKFQNFPPETKISQNLITKLPLFSHHAGTVPLYINFIQ